jgi:hypothetical protein
LHVLNEKLISFALHQILLTVVSVLTFLASVNQVVGIESVTGVNEACKSILTQLSL